MDSFAIVWQYFAMFCPPGRRLVLLLALWLPAMAALCQSARPGWGSTPYHDAAGTGVTFRVWAPNATSVSVPGQFNGWSQTATPLVKELTNGVWDGNWSADVTGAAVGQQYKYYVSFPGGTYWKHDPRARKVVSSSASAGGNDIIYDPAAFNWSNDLPVAPPLNDLVIYELHIGTFYNTNDGGSLPGKFTDATNRLDYLKSLGVSAVEVLPIFEFPGYMSWGYNPADIFAADNYAYGGPDGFKTFVKACHARGLAVLLDVVHNHYGETDLDLWDFDGWSGGGNGGGIYFYEPSPQCCTPWGSRPAYSRAPVADFIRQNFQMWLDEYHVDGFRWDTPGTMLYAGNTFIPEAGALITNINTFIHTNYSGKISIAEDVQSYGFDSAWDTSYPYAITPVLTNTVDAGRNLNTIVNALTNNVRYGGAAGTARVAFLESHDVVGDLNSGVRLPAAIDPAAPDSWRARKLSQLGAALTFTAPGVPMLFQGQEMLENQPFSTGRPVDWTKTNTYGAIVKCYRDLIGLRRNFDGGVSGLQGDQINFLQVDTANQLLAFRRGQSGNPVQDVVVVVNLAGTVRANYSLSFPRAGDWYVHFNSDSTNYGADFSNVGTNHIVAAGASPAGRLNLGPYSVVVLSPVPPTPALTFTSSNRSRIVSWPVSYAGWILESATNLSPTAWTSISTAFYQTNGGVISVTMTSAMRNAFYRLQMN